MLLAQVWASWHGPAAVHTGCSAAASCTCTFVHCLSASMLQPARHKPASGSVIFPLTLSARPKRVRAPSQSSCLAAIVPSRWRACPLSGSRPRSSCSRLCACREQQQAAVRRQWGCHSCHVWPATVKLQLGANLRLLLESPHWAASCRGVCLESRHITDRHPPSCAHGLSAHDRPPVCPVQQRTGCP